MSTAAYIAHVTLRDASVRRVEVPAATSRHQAALMAMLEVGGASRSASARPVGDRVVSTDCCHGRMPAALQHDSAFGCLA